MVSIDFQIDPEVLAKHRSLKPTEETAGVISQIWFRMPIRLVVGGTTILTWAELPLLYMALAIETLRDLPQHGSARISLPEDGSLRLRMEGNEVVITYPRITLPRYASARGSYDELLRAWEDFSNRVRSFLLKEFPDFRDHPQLGDWFRGGDI